jgi:hypothetical protein
LLEAYSLGALDVEESAKVERHIAECADCRLAVFELGETAGVMAQAVASVSQMRVPPALKQRLMNSIESDTGQESKTHAAPPVSMRGLFRPRNLATLAAVALLVISIAWSVRLGVALAEERALKAEFANLVDQQEIVLEIVDSGNTVKRVLRSPQGASSYGKLYTRTDMTHVVAMAARLNPPREGQAYHLWLEDGDVVKLAGSLNINDEGFGLLVLDEDHFGPEYDSAILTLQNEGESEPSDNIILVWNTGQ